MRVVELQQFLPLRIVQGQQFRQSPAYPGGIVEQGAIRVRVFAAALLDQALQQHGQQSMFGPHGLGGTGLAPADIRDLQAVVAHARALDMEAAGATHAQGEQAIVSLAKSSITASVPNAAAVAGAPTSSPL